MNRRTLIIGLAILVGGALLAALIFLGSAALSGNFKNRQNRPNTDSPFKTEMSILEGNAEAEEKENRIKDTQDSIERENDLIDEKEEELESEPKSKTRTSPSSKSNEENYNDNAPLGTVAGYESEEEEQDYNDNNPLGDLVTQPEEEESGFGSHQFDSPIAETEDEELGSLPTPTPLSTGNPEPEETDEEETQSAAVSDEYYSQNSEATAPERDSEEYDEILTDSSYQCTHPFIDVINHYSEGTTCRMYQAGVIQGRDALHFEPSSEVTRAEFLKMALLQAGYSLSDSSGKTETYQDVHPQDWYYPYVVIAENEGFLRNNTGNFYPNEPMTRGDIVLLARIANQTLYGYSQNDIPYNDVVTTDYFAYALIILSSAYVDDPEQGSIPIISGYSDGSFRPNSTMSRGEAALILSRFYQAYFAR